MERQRTNHELFKSIGSILICSIISIKLDFSKTMMLHIRHASKHFVVNGSAINILICSKVIECCATIRLNLIHIKGYNIFTMLVKKTAACFFLHKIDNLIA